MSTERIYRKDACIVVFLDVADYQQLVDKLDLMMDIYKGEQDIVTGRVHSTDDVRRAIASDLGVSI